VKILLPFILTWDAWEKKSKGRALWRHPISLYEFFLLRVTSKTQCFDRKSYVLLPNMCNTFHTDEKHIQLNLLYSIFLYVRNLNEDVQYNQHGTETCSLITTMYLRVSCTLQTLQLCEYCLTTYLHSYLYNNFSGSS